MEPVVYQRVNGTDAVVNPSALDELVANNCTMPNIERVIFNLSKADVMQTTVVEENGKKAKKTEKVGERDVLATVITFIDGTKVAVKNSLTDAVDLVEKTLADGSKVTVASDAAKERGIVFAVFKRICSMPDASGMCNDGAIGRILRNVVADAYDQPFEIAKTKVARAAAKAEYARKLNTAKNRPRAERFSINGTLARINALLDKIGLDKAAKLLKD